MPVWLSARGAALAAVYAPNLAPEWPRTARRGDALRISARLAGCSTQLATGASHIGHGYHPCTKPAAVATSERPHWGKCRQGPFY